MKILVFSNHENNVENIFYFQCIFICSRIKMVFCQTKRGDRGVCCGYEHDGCYICSKLCDNVNV